MYLKRAYSWFHAFFRSIGQLTVFLQNGSYDFSEILHEVRMCQNCCGHIFQKNSHFCEKAQKSPQNRVCLPFGKILINWWVFFIAKIVHKCILLFLQKPHVWKTIHPASHPSIHPSSHKDNRQTYNKEEVTRDLLLDFSVVLEVSLRVYFIALSWFIFIVNGARIRGIEKRISSYKKVKVVWYWSFCEREIMLGKTILEKISSNALELHSALGSLFYWKEGNEIKVGQGGFKLVDENRSLTS